MNCQPYSTSHSFMSFQLATLPPSLFAKYSFTCLPWMRKAPCRKASSVLKIAFPISCEEGQARLPTGYQPPLTAPSSSVAPTLRKNTLNSGEPPVLSSSYLPAACHPPPQTTKQVKKHTIRKVLSRSKPCRPPAIHSRTNHQKYTNTKGSVKQYNSMQTKAHARAAPACHAFSTHPFPVLRDRRGLLRGRFFAESLHAERGDCSHACRA